jgi:hypothetical protein
MMKKTAQQQQTGGSLLGNIILLALFAYGVFVGIQYVPMLLESKSLDSMLDTIESQHVSNNYESSHQVEQAVKSILNLNQMDDMFQHVKIRQSHPNISIEIDYERELDLLYEKKTLHYSKVLDLD